MNDQQHTAWTRERRSFSCDDSVWDAAKAAWANDIETYPAWTYWLEAALVEAIDATRDRHKKLATAPAKIPPGRRDGPPASPLGRTRRSFTCQPHIWTQARDAWWTDRDTHLNLSDWISAAITAKTRTITDHDPTKQRT